MIYFLLENNTSFHIEVSVLSLMAILVKHFRAKTFTSSCELCPFNLMLSFKYRNPLPVSRLLHGYIMYFIGYHEARICSIKQMGLKHLIWKLTRNKKQVIILSNLVKWSNTLLISCFYCFQMIILPFIYKELSKLRQEIYSSHNQSSSGGRTTITTKK